MRRTRRSANGSPSRRRSQSRPQRLHPWKILVGTDGRARFYDFGDGVVAHPFSSMLLGLGWFPLRLGIEPEDRAFLLARDAYLKVFSDLAPHAELVETLKLACRVGKVAGALTWERAIRELAEEGAEHADAPFETMGVPAGRLVSRPPDLPAQRPAA